MKKILISVLCVVFHGLFSVTHAAPGEWVYTVVDEDNLWDISERYLDTGARFEALQKINNVRYPTRMRPGTRLRIPMKWIRSNPVPASVKAVVGEARIRRASGTGEEVIEAGTRIFLGDRILTGPGSSLAIRFADDTLLTLFENSVARFDHLSAHGTTGMVDSRLKLLKGRMDARVTPASGPGSRFEIHTPSAISAVRGTRYRAAFDDDGTLSRIEVLHGKVEVSANRRKRLVSAGFGTQVREDKPPLRPRKLLAPPKLKPLPGRIRQINWPVTWEARKGAAGYRAEIAADADFTTILWQQRGDYPRVDLPDLPDGNYHLRVSGIDETGLEGLNAVVPLVLDVRPQAPILLHPVDKKVLRGTTPELKWSDSPEADRYHLEIASDAAFENLLVDKHDISGTRYDARELAEIGTYHWRLTSIAGDGEYGPKGLARSWEVKPVPEKVEPALDASEDGLLASWPETLPGQSYQVQLASDGQFQQILLDELRSEPNIRFDQVKGTVRYLRVKAIAPDGYQGPWGTAQRIDPLPDKSIWMIPGLGILGFLLL